MDKTVKKYKELLEEFQQTLGKAKTFNEKEIDTEIAQTMRECRQMIERLRRLKDGESLTYEPVAKEEPVI